MGDAAAELIAQMRAGNSKSYSDFVFKTNVRCVIYNPDGDRAPNKFVHVRQDGRLQPYGPMDQEHREDGNRQFLIEPYKLIHGKPTYLIFNADGDRRPNSYWHIAEDGHVYPYGPTDEEHKNNKNRHFVIEPLDDGSGCYIIYNNDGDRAPNQLVHIREDGHLQAYNTKALKDNGNRHFIIEEA